MIETVIAIVVVAVPILITIIFFRYVTPLSSLNKTINMNKELELDRLLKLEKKWTHMFDSDTRVGLALLEEIRKLNNKDMLQRYIQKIKIQNKDENRNN